MSGPWKRDKPSFEDREFVEKFWAFLAWLGLAMVFALVIGWSLWSLYLLLCKF